MTGCSVSDADRTAKAAATTPPQAAASAPPLAADLNVVKKGRGPVSKPPTAGRRTGQGDEASREPVRKPQRYGQGTRHGAGGAGGTGRERARQPSTRNSSTACETSLTSLRRQDHQRHGRDGEVGGWRQGNQRGWPRALRHGLLIAQAPRENSAWGQFCEAAIASPVMTRRVMGSAVAWRVSQFPVLQSARDGFKRKNHRRVISSSRKSGCSMAADRGCAGSSVARMSMAQGPDSPCFLTTSQRQAGGRSERDRSAGPALAV